MAKESLAVSWSYQMLSTWVLHWGHNEAGDFCTSLKTLQLFQGVLVLWAKGQGLAQNPPGQQGKSHVGIYGHHAQHKLCSVHLCSEAAAAFGEH